MNRTEIIFTIAAIALILIGIIFFFSAPKRKNQSQIVSYGPTGMNMYASTRRYSPDRPGHWGNVSHTFNNLENIVEYGS